MLKYNYIDINNYKQWNFINNFNQDKIVITDTNLFNEKVFFLIISLDMLQN